ncbi:putative ankyrin repeat protein [Eutypa lata UCREL1]|uniref:Putative ankyrin repeat protein n=1 Tax=Eutypa lata (strain UCR-EL1) TaxID=1287681 RepID=M7SB79_EUTLA|nr:putative ankyrin repeat protein [Eutypa lata UCREL1]
MTKRAFKQLFNTDEDVVSFIINRSVGTVYHHPKIPEYLVNGALRGPTALHIAVFNGNLEISKLLVKHGADVNAKMDNGVGDTPLMIAVGSHRRELTSFLLKESADVRYINDDYATSMTLAVQSGNLFAIKALEAYGAMLSTRSWDGTSLLEISIDSENLSIFDYLRRRGLDPNEANVWGESVANRAIKHVPFRSYLLNTDRSMDFTTSPINIFSWAADRNDTVLIKLLYRSLGSSAGASALEDSAGNRAGHGQQKQQHLSPLCAAARAGHVECVELLLSLGADVEKEGCEDGTPIMAAAAFGRLEVVKVLLRRGAGKEGAQIEYCEEKNADETTRRNLLRAARGRPDITKIDVIVMA